MPPRFTVVPAVYAIITHQGKYLLSLRKNTGFMDGYYGLVAGHVESEESPTQACIRELKEECNLTVESDDLKFKLVQYRKSDDRTSFEIFFEIQVIDIESIKNQESEKCGGLDWFSPNNLPENIIPYIKNVILTHAPFIEI